MSMRVVGVAMCVVALAVTLMMAAHGSTRTIVTIEEAQAALGGGNLYECEIQDAGCWVANNPAGGLACQHDGQDCFACTTWDVNKACELWGINCTQLADVPCGAQYDGKCRKNAGYPSYWTCIPTGPRREPDCIGVHEWCN